MNKDDGGGRDDRTCTVSQGLTDSSNCPCCGAPLSDERIDVLRCEYCGAVFRRSDDGEAGGLARLGLADLRIRRERVSGEIERLESLLPDAAHASPLRLGTVEKTLAALAAVLLAVGVILGRWTPFLTSVFVMALAAMVLLYRMAARAFGGRRIRQSESVLKRDLENLRKESARLTAQIKSFEEGRSPYRSQ